MMYAPEEIEAKAARLIAESGLALVNMKDWFIYQSGWRAPVYLDLRRLTRCKQWHEVIRLTGEFVNDVMRREQYDFDGIYGVPRGGTMHAAALAYAMGRSPVDIRYDKKEHGIESSVLGAVRGDKILVCEDTSSKGKSIIGKGVLPLRELNLEMKIEYAVMIAAHTDVSAELERVGVIGLCLCRARTIFDYVLRSHDDETRHIVGDWYSDPAGASANYIAAHS